MHIYSIMVKLATKKTKALQARRPAPRPAKKVGRPAVARQNSLVSTRVLPKPASLPAYVNAMIDPVMADPVRVPDDHVSPTVALKLTDEYTITSDAAGYAVWGVSPSLSNARQGWTVTAGSTGAAPSFQAAHPESSNCSASFKFSRECVYEIEVNYIGAELNAAGRLVAIESTSDATYNSVVLDTIIDDGESAPAQYGRRIVVRPTQAPRFEDAGALGSAYMTPTFAYWAFVGVGLPATTVCFSVRVTRHFEGIPHKTSLLRGVAVPEPYNPSSLTIAANMSQSGKHGKVGMEGKKAMTGLATAAAHAAWANLGPQVSSTVQKYGAQAAGWAGEALMALM
jgi:hypothetical protein